MGIFYVLFFYSPTITTTTTTPSSLFYRRIIFDCQLCGVVVVVRDTLSFRILDELELGKQVE